MAQITVDNLAHSYLRNRGMDPAFVAAQVQKIARMIGMEDVLGRKARALTADAKQKISLGRGMVREDVNAILFAEAAPFALFRTRRILVVRSASVTAADDLVRSLRKDVDVLEIVARGEPDLPGVLADCTAARPFRPELVVAIGGGAVIDHGKALAALVPAPHGPLRYLEVVGEGQPLDAAPLPVIAISTTAGTGSEVTRNAVIQVPEAARKVSLRDPRLYPALAIVDPDLAASCPRHVALASGLDDVTQVIEPFVSRRAIPLTDALCRDAMPRVSIGIQS